MTKRKAKEIEARPKRAPVDHRLRWYCVRTKQAQERKAAINLASQGFHVFFPLQTVTISHAGQIQRAPRPLFPRYVFVEIDVALELHGPIKSTRGCVRLLCNLGGDPQAIPDKVIEDIRRREELEKMKTGEIRSGFEAGDKIHILVGTFAGFDAIYIGEERGHATVIIVLFGRENVVTVDLDRLPIERSIAKAA